MSLRAGVHLTSEVTASKRRQAMSDNSGRQCRSAIKHADRVAQISA